MVTSMRSAVGALPETARRLPRRFQDLANLGDAPPSSPMLRYVRDLPKGRCMRRFAVLLAVGAMAAHMIEVAGMAWAQVADCAVGHPDCIDALGGPPLGHAGSSFRAGATGSSHRLCSPSRTLAPGDESAMNARRFLAPTTSTATRRRLEVHAQQ